MKTGSKPKDRVESVTAKRKTDKLPTVLSQESSPKEGSGNKNSQKPPGVPARHLQKKSPRKSAAPVKQEVGQAAPAPARKAPLDKAVPRSASEINELPRLVPNSPKAQKPKKRASLPQEKRPRNLKPAPKSQARPAPKTAAEAPGRQSKPSTAPRLSTVQTLEAKLREERRHFAELLSKKDRMIFELEKKVRELQQSKTKD